MTTLKSLTTTLLLLIGIHTSAWAEGPAPLPFDSQGFSDSAKQKPTAATPTTTATTAAVKDEPKKAVRDNEEEDNTQRVKQCEKIPAKKVKGKKAGPAKTVCKTVLVKQKASKGQSRSNDEEVSKPICKKGKHCKAPVAASEENQVRCKKGKRCNQSEEASAATHTEEKARCKKGRKCKANDAASDEPKKKATKPHSTKKKK